MCNLYSITTNQAAIIALFRVINRYVGNLPPMPGVSRTPARVGGRSLRSSRPWERNETVSGGVLARATRSQQTASLFDHLVRA
jgi:hypothetical protein